MDVLASTYEVAIEMSDARVVENLINSSNFLINNNMLDTFKIVPTKNDCVLRSIWKDEGKEEAASLRKRTEWLAATER